MLSKENFIKVVVEKAAHEKLNHFLAKHGS